MNVKKLLPVVLIILLVLAWYTAISGVIKAPLAYRSHLKKARQYEKEERYQYAIEEYDEAIKAKPDNIELYENKMEDYEKLKEYDSMIETCDTIIDKFEDNKEAYTKKLQYYMKEEEWESAAEVAKEAKKAYPDDKKIKRVYDQLRDTFYSAYASYPQMSAINDGYVWVCDEEGLCGILSESGNSKVPVEYDYVGFYSNEEDSDIQVAPIVKDGELIYVDENGYKALVNDKKYDVLGEVSEGVMSVGKNGKYGYAFWDIEGRKFTAKTKLKWDYAGKMYNGVAAVCKNGKWALLNSKYDEVTKYKYDEIVVDEFGICSRKAVAFVREGKKYKLISTKTGKDITKAEFDDVKPFAGGDMAAVCKNGKWGYIDTNGKLKIKYQYKDAKSFSDKYAPVYKKGAWGYIDKKNHLVIDYQFDDAKQFSANGIAPVMQEENWTLIKPYIY